MPYSSIRWTILVSTLAMLTFATSCSSQGSVQNSTTSSEVLVDTLPTLTTNQVTTQVTTTVTTTAETITQSDKSKYVSLLSLYSDDELSDDLKSVEWTDSMVFTNNEELEEYIDNCMSNCQETIGFIVPMDYQLPDYEQYKTFDKGIWSMQGSQNTLGYEDNKAYFVVYNLKYTTGNLVYHAYVTGDTSNLTPEQLEVYNVATNYINHTLDTSKSILAQEKQIFDYICTTVTYYKDENTSEEYSRYRSSVGALLDGSANCMGYSDTFYLLCSMAGMQVSYVSEESMNHAWNIITLNDKQYLVDTTFADTSYDLDNLNGIGQYPSYKFFNATWDFVSQKYTLSENNPTRNITAYADENSYFYASEFNSHYANANDIYDKIAYTINSTGENPVEYLCTEDLPTTNQKEFINNLRARLSSSSSSLSVGCILQPFNGFGYVLICIDGN